jgi:hypothetical protein
MVLDRVNKRFPNATTAGVGMRSKRVQAGLSTQIIIQVEADDSDAVYTVGAIQDFTYSQSRPLKRIEEVGTDGTIQITPTGTTTFDLTINRIVFDFQRLPQALQREYRHIHAQRRAFNIVVTDYNPYLGAETGANTSGDGNDPVGGGGSLQNPAADGTLNLQNHKLETVFANCWFKSSNFSYKAGDYLIAEQAQLECEHVYDRQVVTTLQGNKDSLERNSNTSKSASVMSAYDAIRQS